MPNHVLNELIFRNVDRATQDAILAKLCNAEGKVDFNVLVPTPVNRWLGGVSQLHEKAFGETALDWSRREWGTKWNAYSHKPIERTDDTLILRFDTAWSPPYPWLVAVFNTFKRAFDHNWLDEGAERGVCGKWNHAALEAHNPFEKPWHETPADDEMQRHLHVLRWGVESFNEEVA
jgi:hypothetical protein